MSDYFKDHAATEAFAKTLLSDNDMRLLVSYAARIAELESQLAKEVERLDFVLGKYAYCAKFSGEISTEYQLIIADEEVDCIALSGEDVNHPTPRAAIDAAIALEKGGK